MNQQTIPGIEKPPRPEATREMIEVAVTKVVSKMDGTVSSDEILREYTYPMDGFELAKELIRNYVDVDRDDVDELDCIDDEVRSLVVAAEKQWVIDHDIQPPFPLGTRAHVKYGRNTVAGVLDHICSHSVASYAVKEDGCTRDGRFMIIKFEDVVGVAS